MGKNMVYWQAQNSKFLLAMSNNSIFAWNQSIDVNSRQREKNIGKRVLETHHFRKSPSEKNYLIFPEDSDKSFCENLSGFISHVRLV